MLGQFVPQDEQISRMIYAPPQGNLFISVNVIMTMFCMQQRSAKGSFKISTKKMNKKGETSLPEKLEPHQTNFWYLLLSTSIKTTDCQKEDMIPSTQLHNKKKGNSFSKEGIPVSMPVY